MINTGSKNKGGFSFGLGHKIMSGLAGYLYRSGYLSEYVDVDTLTGLYNRNFFERWHHKIVSQAERAGVDLVVVSVDVNGLKKMNDSSGHAAGDKMIKSLARLFLKTVRDSDLVIRMGGDEFLLILWNSQLEGAEKMLGRVLEKAKEKELSFSYGLALAEKGKNIMGKIEEADAKMYLMKKAFGTGRS